MIGVLLVALDAHLGRDDHGLDAALLQMVEQQADDRDDAVNFGQKGFGEQGNPHSISAMNGKFDGYNTVSMPTVAR